MPEKVQLRGNSMIAERNIFAVTGGSLTINGGEIHAGRSKDIYANQASEYDKDYKPITNGMLFDVPNYVDLCGYATWFLSGTAITAQSGNVTINGGEIWGRGWDNFSVISRVANNPNGPDDHRNRCAALRITGNSSVTINGGSFYGRSDADAVQVNNPSNLTVVAGTFDVATNKWLVIPALDWYSFAGGSVSQILEDKWFRVSPFDVIEGNIGSPVIPPTSIDYQSDAFLSDDGKTMTIYPLGSIQDTYHIVSDINIYINSPLAYKSPTANSNGIYNLPEGCSVESITWYENGKILDNADSTYFKEDASYYIKIGLKADSTTKFKYVLSDATVNAIDADIYRKDDKHVVLTVQFGKCIAALENVNLYIEDPVQGASPSSLVDSEDNDAYAARGGYSNYADYRKWYVSDDGTSGWQEMTSNDIFEAGKYYKFAFDIVAGEGQEFDVIDSGSIQPNVTAKVNNKTATVSKGYEQDPTKCVTVTYDFGMCPAKIQSIQLTTAYTPVEGETVRYTLTTGSDNYYVVGANSSNYDTYVNWYVSNSGADGTWSKLNRGATFEAGKYYRLYADVHTKSGYTFDTWDNGSSIMPYVSATVNGYYADVNKAYEQDPSEYVTVVFDFGLCNDSVVENIQVVDVTPPVAGEKPSYTYNIFGTGYQMDTSRNAYYDDYMHNQKLYYVKDGISWWDTTTGSWDYVYENDTFIPGHTYACQLYLITEDGYNFTNMTEHSSLPNVTINGNTGEVNEGWTNANEARVFYVFTCDKQEVTTVEVFDLDYPKGGKTPDFTISLGSDLYEPDPNYGTNNSGIYWYDSQGNMLDDGDTFVQGERYKVEIKLIPQKIESVNASTFVSPVTAYINGEQVTERLDWDNVYASANSLYIYYTFIYGAADDEVVPAADTHVHNIVFVDPQYPSCTKYGNLAYCYCTTCGKWYWDENDSSLITDKTEVIIEATGHVPSAPVREDENDETYDEVIYCSACGEEISRLVKWVNASNTVGLSKLTVGDKKITVEWNALAGADKYLVYRKAANATNWSKIGETTKLTFSDTNVSSGTKYTYTVKAQKYSIYSKYDTKGISTFYLAPVSLKVVNDAAGSSLTWSKTTGAQGYYVYRKTGTGSFAQIAKVTSLSYVDKSAKSGTSYVYAVRAYNGTVRSAYKEVSLLRLTNPSVKTSNVAAGIKVEWSKVAGAKSYIVYRKTGSGKYTQIAKGSNLYYVDKSAKAGTAYTYTVRAVNGNTRSAYTGVNTVRLVNPTFSLAKTSAGIKITTTKVAGAKGYYIYRKTSSTAFTKIATTSSLSYVDKTAKKGVKYTYAVRAYNGKVMSAYNQKAMTR